MKDRESVGRRRLSLGPVLTAFFWLWGVGVLVAGIGCAVQFVLHFTWHYLPIFILGLVIVPLWAYRLLSLKIVWGDEHELHVRGFFNAITVPYSQIAEVKYLWRLVGVNVVFKGPTRFGRKIRYVSRHTFVVGRWEHPDVVFLQERMRQTGALPGHDNR